MVGGVSSFGFSGSITHAVLQAICKQDPREAARRVVLRRRLFDWSFRRTLSDAPVCFFATSWLTQPAERRGGHFSDILLAIDSHSVGHALPGRTAIRSVVVLLGADDRNAFSSTSARSPIVSDSKVPASVVTFDSGRKPPAATKFGHGATASQMATAAIPHATGFSIKESQQVEGRIHLHTRPFQPQLLAHDCPHISLPTGRSSVH